MKMLNKKQVKEVTTYAFSTIDRKERSGLFPKRVRLGQNRVAWIEDEVYEYLRNLIESQRSPDCSD